MLRAQHVFANRQGLLIEGIGFRVLALVDVALYLNRRLWPFTALNLVLTQLWCTFGTCDTFALAS
jgi:hypothetical protein